MYWRKICTFPAHQAQAVLTAVVQAGCSKCASTKSACSACSAMPARCWAAQVITEHSSQCEKQEATESWLTCVWHQVKHPGQATAWQNVLLQAAAALILGLNSWVIEPTRGRPSMLTSRQHTPAAKLGSAHCTAEQQPRPLLPHSKEYWFVI